MSTVQEIVTRFDLKRSGRDWRGDCPACGYADAFVLAVGRTGKPVGWCASCQDRKAINRLLGGEPPHPPTLAETAHRAALAARKAERALSLWRGSLPAVNTPVGAYLARRGLPDLANSEALRFRPDCPHPAGGRLPAMVGAVVDAAGTVVGIQRTYLTPDGRKAGVEPVRAGLGQTWGGAIRLHPFDPDKALMIGEGTETTASAGRLIGLPAWAAICAGNLARGLVLPPAVRRVVIAADPDEPGRRAAREAWRRWTAEGRDVKIATPGGSSDFNDMLQSQEAGHG